MQSASAIKRNNGKIGQPHAAMVDASAPYPAATDAPRTAEAAA